MKPKPQKKRFIVLLIAVAIAASGLGAAFGEPLRAEKLPKGVPAPSLNKQDIEPRVVNGVPSNDKRVVGITFVQDGERRICSGLYISTQRVLTAAHCTCNASDYRVSNLNYVSNDWRPAHFVARFGSYNCGGGPRGGNDLALLSIDRPLATESGGATCSRYSLLNNIRLIGEIVRNSPKRVLVAGYGYDGDKPNSWGTRRSTEVGVNSFVCTPTLSQALGCAPLAEFMLGVGRTDGFVRDTCAGDSGGPAYLESSKGFVPLGIVSRGLSVPQPFPQRGRCGTGGIYTHLGRRNVIAWLTNNGVATGGETCSLDR